MNRKPETIVTSLIAVLLLASVTAVGAQTKVKGMISGRTGETLIVTTDSGKVTVVLTEGTKIKDNRGLFGLQEDVMAPTVTLAKPKF